MGTSKKIVLASIVSMLMVLGFLVGLVPNSGTRTDAGTAAGDRVDMVGLLDLVMGVKAVSNVTLTSPVEGVLVKTPVDNAATPVIPVPVQANVVGDGTELVAFAANIYGDATAFPAPFNWSGDVFTEAVPSPFVSAIDLGSFVTGNAGTTTNVAVYALVNATQQATKATTLVYEATNETADYLPFQITETNASVDGDDNGIPDNPFSGTNGVGPGEVWISNQTVNGATRTVLVANLDQGASVSKATLGTIFTSPSNNVTVESPDLTQFQTAGVIGAGETGYLLVQVVDDLAAAVDQVNGGDAATWASNVAAQQPGALLTGGQFVEISLVYSLNGQTQFSELDTLPAGLEVNLTLTGLTETDNTTTGLYHYPTTIVDNGGTVVVSGELAGGEWQEATSTFAGGSLTASLSSLSVFAPLAVQDLPPVSITSINPNQVAQNVATDATLVGVIPTAVALSATEATAAYTIQVGGTTVSFRDNGGAAITAYTGSDNEAAISIPGISAPGFYDVTITENANPSNTFTLTGALEVVATFTLQTEVTGGSGVITVDPNSGPGLPVGTYFANTIVTASIVYDDEAGTKTFGRWLENGSVAGSDPASVSIAVGDGVDPTILTAVIDPIITTAEFYLNVNATAGGSAIVVTAPNGVNDPTKFQEGTVVTINAVPDSGFRFVNWTGGTVANPNSANTTVTVAGDTTLTANFEQISYSVSLAGTNGNVNVLTPPNHPSGVGYLLGTTITIQATPANGYAFEEWQGADAGALSDPSAATTSFTIDGSQSSYSFIAVFSAISTELTITSISPAEAFLFGGVVARISGTGLTDDTIITIGGIQVQGFRAFSNGSSVDVVVPASTDNTSAATVLADVTVSDGVDTRTLPSAFTYIRFKTENGVNTTAFTVDNPEVGTTVDVTLNNNNNSFAELEIPALDVPAGVNNVFGIARNAIFETDKQNTEGIAALGTNSIGAGAQIDGVSDFSLHLYATSEEAKANTPSVGSPTLANASGLVDFGTPVDGNGNPVESSPVLLTFPITGSGLTYGDVKNSLTMWGVQTEFDYVTEVTTVSDPEVVAYESEILNNEVEPALTPVVADSAEPTAIAKARIYRLNGYSLRQGAIVPSEVADGIRLANVSGTATGNVAGGTALRIVSPGGGLAHIDRIVFTQAVAAKAVGGTVTAANIITPSGTNEYEIQFTSPASAQAGIANIVIFGKADPNTPIVQLDRVFQYTKAPFNGTPFVLLLLGLLVAGLGLAAGGDSGGGGGGPCFIATAAYGTPMAAQIDTLRDVRDSYLLSNTVGTAFTDLYYRVSPTIADAVAQSPVLAATVRVLLVPVIFLGKVAMAMPLLSMFVGMSLGAAYLMMRRAARRSM